jgi:uncharacterized short protein YbdD (DUF466 family)
MRTALDTELFPKLCEVVEMPLHNQWIYLIQKNGSSSLRIQQSRDNLAVFTNDQISALDYVDVYIRNPRARYVSGINTYLQHLQRDHPELDYLTAFWFARRYKFLNTHYLPQFYWIANLSKYLRDDTLIRFRNFQTFSNITDINDDARVHKPSQEFIKQLFQDDKSIELWLYLDQILLDLVDKELTWNELLEHYRINHPDVIAHVLP